MLLSVASNLYENDSLKGFSRRGIDCTHYRARKNSIFSLGGPRSKKNQIYKKFYKSTEFLYSGVFRHEEVESEGIFDFDYWKLHLLGAYSLIRFH